MWSLLGQRLTCGALLEFTERKGTLHERWVCCGSFAQKGACQSESIKHTTLVVHAA